MLHVRLCDFVQLLCDVVCEFVNVDELMMILGTGMYDTS
jgi:hypothetical protein